MIEPDKFELTCKYLNKIGKEVFIEILYPSIKQNFNIDYTDVCKMYPDYEKRAVSDISKRTRLSKAKTIIKNGWERHALTIISESKRLDEHIINKAKMYLDLIK